MPGKTSKSVTLVGRDSAMLMDLWKWKLLTTRAIGAKFFPRSQPVIAYNRLLRLKKAGYLQLQSFDHEGMQFAWTLSQKGFDSVLPNLPELKDEGFRSESPAHDHLVTAIHLGEWLTQAPEQVEVFSEQELRRYHPDHYPDWVPKADSRRPDGYWRVPYKDRKITIALEVELNQKTNRKYEVLAHFYEDHPTIFRVIWLVPTLGIAKSLQERFRSEVGDRVLIHDFFLRPDFERLGWQASAVRGREEGKSLAFVLGIRGLEPMHSPMHAACTCMVSALLDTRKRRRESPASAARQVSPFPNRMSSRTSEHLIQITADQGTVNVHLQLSSPHQNPINTDRK